MAKASRSKKPKHAPKSHVPKGKKKPEVRKAAQRTSRPKPKAKAAQKRPAASAKATAAPATKGAAAAPSGAHESAATRAAVAKTAVVKTAAAKTAAAKPAAPARKPSRRSSHRRGHNGERFAPGELLLPGGPQGADEIQYLMRGSVAAEHPARDAGVAEVVARATVGESEQAEMLRSAENMVDRFDSGAIEPLLPNRVVNRRNFQGVVERAKHRRREIGAFLRGLDLGRTESSHMDSHGEASLQSLMEWAARLENLAEADEPDQADYAQFHRGLDQLENTTEALIVDVELTLRRLRDRLRPH
jgi:hypothetical protein